ncbi:hypothetical protein [Roseburia sp. 499]|uniref:hypothetical protein n=1 Tax=Roseburia sp. 499 TaxID=1261634 RepID=UPI00130101B0|nr:hypothetical protein [Roseburia sp. 499]WVK70126.1 hypothetical protein BIV20_00930 [Roseburia sp. 499]
MQKFSWIQWFVRIIRKDMKQYEENQGTKREVYKAVKRKSKYNKSKGGKEL